MSLEEAFHQIPDPIRKQGQRFTIPQLLTMSVLSYLCGHGGYRGTATFCQVHADALIAELGLKHGVPSHDTFWSVISQLNTSSHHLLKPSASGLLTFQRIFRGDGSALMEKHWLLGCLIVMEMVRSSRQSFPVLYLKANWQSHWEIIAMARNQKVKPAHSVNC